jgi:hypothetical protein
MLQLRPQRLRPAPKPLRQRLARRQLLAAAPVQPAPRVLLRRLKVLEHQPPSLSQSVKSAAKVAKIARPEVLTETTTATSAMMTAAAVETVVAASVTVTVVAVETRTSKSQKSPRTMF